MRFILAVAAIVATAAFTGCTHTNDTRTGVRGEFCAFGMCLVPSAMASQAVPVPVTDTSGVFGASVVAPATIVSQPAVATQTQTFMAAPACAPVQAPPPQYPPSFAAAPPMSYAPPQLTK